MDYNHLDIDESLLSLEKDKDKTIADLIKVMLETNDIIIRDKIAFTLVDNFKHSSIEDALVILIRDKRWKNYIGTPLYLLGEYTNNNKYLYFLIEILLKHEIGGEVYMNAYDMLINLHPPLQKSEITKSLKRLKREQKKKTLKRESIELINVLMSFLEQHREIIKFYSYFT